MNLSAAVDGASVPGSDPEPAECLGATYYLNYDHPAIQDYVARNSDPAADPTSRVVQLYYLVRDEWRYNPYTVDPARESFRASHVLGQRQSYCIPKALLLAALCRAIGVPARLGFGDVKNHLSSQRLIDYLRTDLFAFHGYTEVYLNERWVQATPAFDRRLCRKFGVAPLEFDGIQDSLFQEFDGGGRRFMEYVRYHGSCADLPYDWLMEGLARVYPHIYFGERIVDGDLMNEAPV